ncbi:hypothetical protein HOY80DRAFT_880554, partial [Tuber brumale]
VLGVNIIMAPTSFSFTQLQNFFLYTATRKKLGNYYRSCMDSAVLSGEEHLYKSFYQRIVENRNSMNKTEKSAIKFFAYEHLAGVGQGGYL